MPQTTTFWDSGAFWDTIWLWDGEGFLAQTSHPSDVGYLSLAQMFTYDEAATVDSLNPLEAIVPTTDTLTATEFTKYPAYGLDVLVPTEGIGLHGFLTLPDALAATDGVSLYVMIPVFDLLAGTDIMASLHAYLPTFDDGAFSELGQRQAVQVLHFVLNPREALESPLPQGQDEVRRYGAEIHDIGYFPTDIEVKMYVGVTDVTSSTLFGVPILVDGHFILLPFQRSFVPEQEYRLEIKFKLDGETFERKAVFLAEN